MDKKRLLDLKDGLRAAERVADNKLIAHGVTVDDEEDQRQYRQRRRGLHSSLMRDWLDEKDSW